MVEKRLEVQGSMAVGFVDLEKAFDTVPGDKARNSTCPLARDKWIFRRTTKIADIVVRRTTWITAGSVTHQRSLDFGVRF